MKIRIRAKAMSGLIFFVDLNKPYRLQSGSISKLGYSLERLIEIFEKTDGRCRHCGIQLAIANYGLRGERGAWEVDHSVPKSKGGSDNLRNLWALCWKCNMKKLDTHGSHHDKKYEPRSTGGKIVEFFGGRAGDWGTDPRREFRG